MSRPVRRRQGGRPRGSCLMQKRRQVAALQRLSLSGRGGQAEHVRLLTNDQMNAATSRAASGRKLSHGRSHGRPP